MNEPMRGSPTRPAYALAVVRPGDRIVTRLRSLATAADLELTCVSPRKVRTLDLHRFAIAFIAVVAVRDWSVVRSIADSIDIVVFGKEAGVSDAIYALGAGAVGYLALDLPDSTLTRTIKAIRSGEAGFSRAALGEWFRTSGLAHAPAVGPELPRRQREILDRIARGQTDTEIARDLGIATATVRKHVQRMFARLRAPNRAAAVTRATRS